MGYVCIESRLQLHKSSFAEVIFTIQHREKISHKAALSVLRYIAAKLPWHNFKYLSISILIWLTDEPLCYRHRGFFLNMGCLVMHQRSPNEWSVTSIFLRLKGERGAQIDLEWVGVYFLNGVEHYFPEVK